MCSARQVRTTAQAQQASTAKNAIASPPVGESPIAAPMSTTARAIAAVEHAPGAVRPRLEVAAALAPDEEEEERDREEEPDPQQPAGDREHRLEREHDDDERDQGDDREAANGSVLEEAPHDPVMVPRTPSAAATSAETANQSRRRRGSAGA